MPDVAALTADYEGWLGEHIPLDAGDLRRKHGELAHDDYRFLRGTYYLWLVRAATEAPETFGHAGVPLVGDVHVENFGTWRDSRGVRRWGVNDLDELARGPWLLDLLRLAASAMLAPHVSLADDAVCDTVLGAWYDATPGPAVELRAAPRLSDLLPEAPDADDYYVDLERLRLAHDVPDEVVAAARGTAPPGWVPTWHVREAGTGSLGHRRRAGVGRVGHGGGHGGGQGDEGGRVAREAKELGPPTCVWFARQETAVEGPVADASLYAAVLAAVRGPAAAARVGDWQVRELAPDVQRISPEHRHGQDARRLLVAMARAVADVHGADPVARERARDEHVSESDFRAVVSAMADVVRADFRHYR